VSAISFEPDSIMEFGFEPVCDQLRTGSSYLDMFDGFEAKFHYAILVADRFEPASNRMA